MLSLELLQLIISAISQSFVFSQLYTYNQEIVDGGTENRIWSFISIVTLTSFTFNPFIELGMTGYLSLGTYAIMAVAGLVQYVASVFHSNQIAINQEKLDKIQKLPYDLHKNARLKSVTLFLSCHMAKGLQVIYLGSLVGCIFLGAPLYAYTSLALLSVNFLNQQGYLPSFLRTPYLYLNMMILLASIFGVSSWISVSLSVAMIGYTVFDYVRHYLLGAGSPTAQYLIADPTKKPTIEPISDDAPDATAQLNFMVQKQIENKANLGLHVTFNHFYEGRRIMEKILDGSPKVNYEDYLLLFEGLNVQSDCLKEVINNEMCLHDKFNEKGLDEHCTELKLPPNALPIDIQMAYLNREMRYFVDRLQHPSYRDLSHQQVAEIHRNARFILNYIKNERTASNKVGALSKREMILVAIATRTGSHCNRVYLDTLSEISSEPAYGILKGLSLTLQERAVLMAQSAREAAFRRYYYDAAPIFKKMSPIFAATWQDLNDYHTYEDFVAMFGGNFYLRNPALNNRFRMIFDVLQDKYWFYLLRWARPDLLFSHYYNMDYLIEQVVEPGGALHQIFIEWCEEKYPSCYNKLVYDEDMFLNKGPELDALAELMLLDLGILGLSKAYPTNRYLPVPTMPNRVSATPSPEAQARPFPFFGQHPGNDVVAQQERSEVQCSVIA